MKLEHDVVQYEMVDRTEYRNREEYHQSKVALFNRAEEDLRDDKDEAQRELLRVVLEQEFREDNERVELFHGLQIAREGIARGEIHE